MLFRSRTADLVDCQRRHGAGNPGVDHGLAGWRLPRSALNYLPHNDFVHLGCRNPGPGKRFPNDNGAQLGSGKGSKTAEIAPDGSTDSGNDDGGGGVGHTGLKGQGNGLGGEDRRDGGMAGEAGCHPERATRAKGPDRGFGPLGAVRLRVTAPSSAPLPSPAPGTPRPASRPASCPPRGSGAPTSPRRPPAVR